MCASPGSLPPGTTLTGRDPGTGCQAWTALRQDRRHLEDRAAGRDLHGGDTPRVQHHEPIAVSTTQHPGVLRQRRHDAIDSLTFAPQIRLLVRDIHAVAADKTDTKHKAFHVRRLDARSAHPPWILFSTLGEGRVPPKANDRSSAVQDGPDVALKTRSRSKRSRHSGPRTATKPGAPPKVMYQSREAHDPRRNTRSVVELSSSGGPQEHLHRIAVRSIRHQSAQHGGAE